MYLFGWSQNVMGSALELMCFPISHENRKASQTTKERVHDKKKKCINCFLFYSELDHSWSKVILNFCSTVLGRLPLVRTGWPERTGLHRCKRNVKADSRYSSRDSCVEYRQELMSTPLQIYLRDFVTFRLHFSRLFLEGGGEYSVFEWFGRGICIFLVISLLSRLKLAKIADYFELTGLRCHYHSGTIFGKHPRQLSSLLIC